MSIHYQKLTLSKAKEKISEIDQLNDTEFADLVQHWNNYDIAEDYDSSYSDFRKTIVDEFKKTLLETDGKVKDFRVDLKIGLILYRLLSPREGFTNIMANDDDIWRYISVRVLPDLTYMRYPNPAKGDIRICSKRFYSHTRRIWVKTLWWFIHLSWQGSEEKTFEVLKNNNVDDINKLIETPGKGYRLSLYRIIMREYSSASSKTKIDFNSITKLNNAKCATVIPALCAGGEKAYAKNLINEVIDGGNKNAD